MAVSGAETWTLREVEQKYLLLFNVVLENYGERELDSSCEKWRSVTQKKKEG
jgi:hypothetical protein